MQVFKVKRGVHVQDDMLAEVPEGGKRPERIYREGELVHSETDLVAKLGEDKVERVDGGRSAAPFGAVAVAPGGQVTSGRQQTTSLKDGRSVSGPLTREVAPSDSAADQYDGMSDEELLAAANAKQLDVSDVGTREELLAKLRA